jgi:hypothetical protein
MSKSEWREEFKFGKAPEETDIEGLVAVGFTTDEVRQFFAASDFDKLRILHRVILRGQFKRKESEMEVREEWTKLKGQLIAAAPAIKAGIGLMEEDLQQALTQASNCDPRAVYYATIGCELASAIRRDAEHLRDQKIIPEDVYSSFADELYNLKSQMVNKVIETMGKCICKKG